MPAPRASIPPTPHTYARFAGVNSPSPISHICRRQMSIPTSPISHICRRQMSLPPRHLWRGGGRQAGGEVTFPLAKYLTSAVGRCLFPLAIYGEGVADRPGVRSRVADNAGGEINSTGTDKSTTTSPNTDSRVSLLFRNRIDSSVNRACPPKTHSSLAP